MEKPANSPASWVVIFIAVVLLIFLLKIFGAVLSFLGWLIITCSQSYARMSHEQKEIMERMHREHVLQNLIILFSGVSEAYFIACSKASLSRVQQIRNYLNQYIGLEYKLVHLDHYAVFRLNELPVSTIEDTIFAIGLTVEIVLKHLIRSFLDLLLKWTRIRCMTLDFCWAFFNLMQFMPTALNMCQHWNNT